MKLFFFYLCTCVYTGRGLIIETGRWLKEVVLLYFEVVSKDMCIYCFSLLSTEDMNNCAAAQLLQHKHQCVFSVIISLFMQYKGQANLHVFEDWCGSSTADLRKNLHYPLYPHLRTTVQKLAVAPQWTNYGLRIFGYLHPYTDGEFVFALSSDDNAELWLSEDDSPLNVQLLAWVGETGTEWTAPGEFEKYASQTSRPIRLSAQRRYYFEVIHKQNDKGTDHVEVAVSGCTLQKFRVIESKDISLFVNESALLMSDVAHIPQTAASHQPTPTKQHSTAADMLREDPRDALYQVPLLNSNFLQGLLPDCSYKPSYTIKDFPLLRYQGLQFVHMSYIYPNDYTRLTHMESENSCFYHETPYYIKRFGFSKYMRLDHLDMQRKGNARRGKVVINAEDEFVDEAYRRTKMARLDQMNNALLPDYGDDYDDYARQRRRKLFSLDMQGPNNTLNSSDTRLHVDALAKGQKKDRPHEPKPLKANEPLQSVQSTKASKRHLKQKRRELKLEEQVKKVEQIKQLPKKKRMRQKVKSVEASVRPLQTNPQIQVHSGQFKARKGPVEQNQIRRAGATNQNQTQRLKDSKLHPIEKDVSLPDKHTVDKKLKFVTGQVDVQPAANTLFTTPKDDSEYHLLRLSQKDTDTRKYLRDKNLEINMPLQQDSGKNIHRDMNVARGKMHKKWADTKGEEDQAWDAHKVRNRAENKRKGGRDSIWGHGLNFEGADDEELTPPPVFDTEVNWSQTFQFNHLDLQTQRSDWIDLHCNVSGNVLLHSSDALPIVKAFMEQLNEKHHGRFTLVRVVNVVKRADGILGSRYLLELELKDQNGQLLRLSQYIYALISHRRQRSQDYGFQRSKPEVVLCNPVGFQWNPAATVHFIVPVKNQARWVLQLIADMEKLYRVTGDTNFNLIITDYNSTDVDVRKALEKSSVPRYVHQYVKLSGNFERSAGLQAGINLINDDHSIVFLCDLHIHFPPSIIDTIRKHCVEGYMAFAPIVMRLNCGATPLEPRGYWEVNGFGLLGIYKSDLDAVGGMNTREFRDRWGGRGLGAGLEVERIFLRNFFHHYHSKRGMWNRRMAPNHR
uniref:Beta-1,4-N-acetylgalactosaminyltransferase n=1 Tax=Mastacembelus armatus TaxID=205130 RepID=A0A3Q3M3H2_9TELE